MKTMAAKPKRNTGKSGATRAVASRKAATSSRSPEGPSPGAELTPEQFLAAIPDPARRADMEALHRLIRETVPALAPHLSMGTIGYGSYHYRYDTGREGDSPIIALSNRAQYVSLYVMGVEDGRFVAESYRAKLPKADIGRACVRFKRLADVDRNVLARLITAGARAIARTTRASASETSERRVTA